MQSSSKILVRPVRRNDMPDVLRIEQSAFDKPWSDEEFESVNRDIRSHILVAEYQDRIVGYVAFEFGKSSLSLLNIAVSHVRRGFGTAMLSRVIEDQTRAGRNRISAVVRETNVGAQLFLRSLGFRAYKTRSSYYDDSAEDAYFFRYRVHQCEGV